MNEIINIGGRAVGKEQPCFIIAEMSGNHNMDFNRAVRILEAAKYAGADAIKLQTYTADTITIDCDEECFRTRDDSLWSGTTLYELYKRAYTPWEWQPKLKEIADELGIILFSSPFDLSSVDFLEGFNVPAYKIASFEITDIPLIRKVAKTKKPIIISTGIARLSDIELAIKTCYEEGNHNVILLKCTSAYPAPYNEMNLKSMHSMQDIFQSIVGLSDHTLGDEIALAATALGSKVIEKHLTLNRSDGGPDAEFSMEPEEFRIMVNKVRNVESALGTKEYIFDNKMEDRRKDGRSLFFVEDMKCGEEININNVKSIRPGIGLHTKYWENLMGRKVKRDVKKGTPVSWDDFD